MPTTCRRTPGESSSWNEGESDGHVSKSACGDCPRHGGEKRRGSVELRADASVCPTTANCEVGKWRGGSSALLSGGAHAPIQGCAVTCVMQLIVLVHARHAGHQCLQLLHGAPCIIHRLLQFLEFPCHGDVHVHHLLEVKCVPCVTTQNLQVGWGLRSEVTKYACASAVSCFQSPHFDVTPTLSRKHKTCTVLASVNAPRQHSARHDNACQGVRA